MFFTLRFKDYFYSFLQVYVCACIKIFSPLYPVTSCHYGQQAAVSVLHRVVTVIAHSRHTAYKQVVNIAFL